MWINIVKTFLEEGLMELKDEYAEWAQSYDKLGSITDDFTG
jgi:hypothetical protein